MSDQLRQSYVKFIKLLPIEVVDKFVYLLYFGKSENDLLCILKEYNIEVN